MTPAAFRRMALSLPDAVEGTHMGHDDFRVSGKVFATLGWPDETFGMVKLPPELQEVLVHAAPEAFEPASGAWGRQGSTMVRLTKADTATLRAAIRSAWQRIAAVKPKPRSRKRV